MHFTLYTNSHSHNTSTQNITLINSFPARELPKQMSFQATSHSLQRPPPPHHTDASIAAMTLIALLQRATVKDIPIHGPIITLKSTENPRAAYKKLVDAGIR
jgi:hypothetical protein